MTPPLLSVSGLVKRFGAVTACDGIDLEVRAGEAVALLGENGAGKSTLIQTVFGVHRPDGGTIAIDGRSAAFGSPRDAMAAGIGMVFQNFSLIPALSVRDNLLMAWPETPRLIGRRAEGAMARLRELAPGIDPAARLGALSVAEHQLVDLSRALNLRARLVILDEPTSVLTPAEAQRLHRLTRRLADGGAGVILVTHKIADVQAGADRYVVMRRGRVVLAGPTRGATPAALVRAVMGDGGDQPALTRRPAPARPVPRLVLDGVATDPGRGAVVGISLSVGRGEIVGVAGVAGNGQTALAEAVAGVAPLAEGDVLLDGISVARRPDGPLRPPAVGYVPPAPRENAVAEQLALLDN